MFERFTDRSRRVVVLAGEEARMLNHDRIGTEHVLLGLMHEGESIAARALESLGAGLQPAREQVEAIAGRGKKPPSGHVPFTPRAKKALELSLREALHLGDNYIGPEHILLGLLREGDGAGVQVLVGLGADLNRVRQQVIRLISAERGQAEAETAGPGSPRAESEGAGLPAAPWSSRDVWQAQTLQLLSRITDRLDAIERHLGIRSGPEQPRGPQAQAPGEEAEGEPGGAVQQPGEDAQGEPGGAVQQPGEETGGKPGGGEAAGD